MKNLIGILDQKGIKPEINNIKILGKPSNIWIKQHTYKYSINQRRSLRENSLYQMKITIQQIKIP